MLATLSSQMESAPRSSSGSGMVVLWISFTTAFRSLMAVLAALCVSLHEPANEGTAQSTIMGVTHNIFIVFPFSYFLSGLQNQAYRLR